MGFTDLVIILWCELVYSPSIFSFKILHAYIMQITGSQKHIEFMGGQFLRSALEVNEQIAEVVDDFPRMCCSPMIGEPGQPLHLPDFLCGSSHPLQTFVQI